MEKTKAKTQQEYYERGMPAHINDSIYALASHLCAYSNVLRQLAEHNAVRQKTPERAFTVR